MQPIEVTQADIDAAANLALATELDWLGGGGYFASITAEAFARHRLAERAKIVAELRDLDGRRDESNLLGWAANHIEAKFGGGDD